MSTLVFLSVHGEYRVTTRENVNKKQAYNLAERAWRNGKTVDDFSGQTRKRLASIEKRHSDNATIRVFGGGCYIFSDEATLITEYRLDSRWFDPKPPRYRESYLYDEENSCDFYPAA